jgi:hypothetical protein
LRAQIDWWKAGKQKNKERYDECKRERDERRRELDTVEEHEAKDGEVEKDHKKAGEVEKDHKKALKKCEDTLKLNKRLYKNAKPADEMLAGLMTGSTASVASGWRGFFTSMPALESGLFALTSGESLCAIVFVDDFVLETDSPDELVTKLNVAYEVCERSCSTARDIVSLSVIPSLLHHRCSPLLPASDQVRDRNSKQVISEEGSHVQFPIERDGETYDVLLVLDDTIDAKEVSSLFCNQLYCVTISVEEFLKDGASAWRRRCTLCIAPDGSPDTAKIEARLLQLQATCEFVNATLVKTDPQKCLVWILLQGIAAAGTFDMKELIKERIQDDARTRVGSHLDVSKEITVDDPLESGGHLKPVITVWATYLKPSELSEVNLQSTARAATAPVKPVLQTLTFASLRLCQASGQGM